jgi:hypothetical protein
MYFRKHLTACVSALLLMASFSPSYGQDSESFGSQSGIRRVLLISIDGFHSLDYMNCVNGISGANNGAPYCPTLAALSQSGVNYTQASASKPSDSFPGLMAIVAGGSPRTVGAFYDVAYDRVLAPPSQATGNGVAAGTCTPGVPNGTTTEYEEGIDYDQTMLNGGAPQGDGGISSINPDRLPRDPDHNCAPVYPWNFVRTNTIFGVIHSAGGYTAWSDKHPAYSSVSGPGDGTNIDDYYSPEINSTVVGLPGVTLPSGQSCAAVLDPSQTGAWTDSFQNIQCYDMLKVRAILNEIDGKKHDGGSRAKTPNIFGMNFQAVSVGQKLIEKNVGSGGYLDAYGTPSTSLLNEIQFVDTSIGMMVSELKKRGLYSATLIVITAKHGQSPIDPQRFFPVPGPDGTNGATPADVVASLLPDSESPNNPTGIGPTQDDISLLWLSDSSQTGNAISMLQQNAKAAGIGEIFVGSGLLPMFHAPGLPPTGDPRTPDIIVTPNPGVIYTGSSKKLEEHGGLNHDDTNVILLLANPNFHTRTINAPVETMQVAPTILKALGLKPASLQSVVLEGTQVLPGTEF